MGACLGKSSSSSSSSSSSNSNSSSSSNSNKHNRSIVLSIKDTVEYVPKVSKCTVIKVYDGDTITVASKIPGDNTLYRFNVRFRGIDAPEMKPTNPISISGQEEKEVACMARDFLSGKVMNQKVELRNIGNEKFGRILADVFCNGQNMSDCMLAQRLAIPYGGTEPKSWKKFHSDGSLV